MGMIKQNGSQNNKFTMYLQYLKKYGVKRDEVDFFEVEFPTSWFQYFGHQIFLQGDTIVIEEHDQAFSKYSKYQVCNTFTIS